MSGSKKVLTTKFIANVAVLGAVAFVLMLFDFPLLFIAPSFYKLDFSEVSVLIGGLDNQRFGVTGNVGYDTKGSNVRGGVGLRVIF